jgi:hypothetical protein
LIKGGRKAAFFIGYELVQTIARIGLPILAGLPRSAGLPSLACGLEAEASARIAASQGSP